MLSGVHHAGQILNLFTTGAPEWGAADVGRSLGMSRSHAHRLLSTLAEVGLLNRVEPGGRFRLSWTWFEYVSVISASDPLISSSVPIMRKLKRKHGVDSLLAVWREGSLVSFSPETVPAVTRREFAECSALGLVLMAGLRDDELDAHVASAPRSAGYPPRDEVAHAVQQVRSGGLLARSDPNAEGRWLAAPVMDCHSIVAALGVYARGAHCPDGQSAIAVVKKASASLTSCLRRRTA
ncbi:MAG TPA: helix-turn-helix domain-containing protein [Glaciibacter sp.]|nr:helix-turn-helix domain-containing protein [Glaciibacter sp.]